MPSNSNSTNTITIMDFLSEPPPSRTRAGNKRTREPSRSSSSDSGSGGLTDDGGSDGTLDLETPPRRGERTVSVYTSHGIRGGEPGYRRQSTYKPASTVLNSSPKIRTRNSSSHLRDNGIRPVPDPRWNQSRLVTIGIVGQLLAGSSICIAD